MKKTLAVLIAATMTLTLAACSRSGNASTTGSVSSTAGSKTLPIGVLEPKTGENGSAGAQEALGIAYAQSLRPTATVAGVTYNVVLDWQDPQSDKTTAVTAAKKLIADGCAAVIGSYDPDACIAAGSLFAAAQRPAITPSCTAAAITLNNDYYFRACYLPAFQGTVLADWATKAGYKEIATINSIGTDYTSALVTAFTAEFEKNGGKVLDAETFQTNTSDFTYLLTNLKKSGVKAVFSPTDSTYAPLLLNQAAAQKLKVQWISGDAWDTPSLFREAAKNAEGVVVDSAYAEGANATFDKGFQAWIAANSARVTANAGSSAIVGSQALAFDCYNALLDAIEKANSLKGPDIRDALAALDRKDAVCGELTFDADGNAVKTSTCILKVKDGAFQFSGVADHAN